MKDGERAEAFKESLEESKQKAADQAAAKAKAHTFEGPAGTLVTAADKQVLSAAVDRGAVANSSFTPAAVAGQSATPAAAKPPPVVFEVGPFLLFPARPCADLPCTARHPGDGSRQAPPCKLQSKPESQLVAALHGSRAVLSTLHQLQPLKVHRCSACRLGG